MKPYSYGYPNTSNLAVKNILSIFYQKYEIFKTPGDVKKDQIIIWHVVRGEVTNILLKLITRVVCNQPDY